MVKKTSIFLAVSSVAVSELPIPSLGSKISTFHLVFRDSCSSEKLILFAP
jgi:hypothetical protein